MASQSDINLAKQLKQYLYEAMVLYSQKKIDNKQLEQVFYDYLKQLPATLFLDSSLTAIWQDKSSYGPGAYMLFTATLHNAQQRLLKEKQGR